MGMGREEDGNAERKGRWGEEETDGGVMRECLEMGWGKGETREWV